MKREFIQKGTCRKLCDSVKKKTPSAIVYTTYGQNAKQQMGALRSAVPTDLLCSNWIHYEDLYAWGLAQELVSKMPEKKSLKMKLTFGFYGENLWRTMPDISYKERNHWLLYLHAKSGLSQSRINSRCSRDLHSRWEINQQLWCFNML